MPKLRRQRKRNNEKRHKRETAPLLFGEGALDLQDPEQQQQPDAFPEGDGDEKKTSGGGTPGGKKKKKKKGKGGYGSTTATTQEKKKIAFDEEEDEEEDDDFDEEQQHDEDSENQLSAAARASKPHVPPINPCLWMFHLLQGIGVAAALCLVATQVLPLVLMPREELLTKMGVLAIALKVYISLFCAVFVLVETDLPVPFVRDSTLLQQFFSRGFLYSFLGLICVEEAYSERVREIVSNKDQFHVGWAGK